MMATLPFLIPLVVTLLLITFIPAITMWLPTLLFRCGDAGLGAACKPPSGPSDDHFPRHRERCPGSSNFLRRATIAPLA